MVKELFPLNQDQNNNPCAIVISVEHCPGGSWPVHLGKKKKLKSACRFERPNF